MARPMASRYNVEALGREKSPLAPSCSKIPEEAEGSDLLNLRALFALADFRVSSVV
jgi:hypothetical protein